MKKKKKKTSVGEKKDQMGPYRYLCELERRDEDEEHRGEREAAEV